MNDDQDRLPLAARRAIDEVRRLDPPDDVLRTVFLETAATSQERRLLLRYPAVAAGTFAAALALLLFVAIPRPSLVGPSSGPAGTPIHVLPADLAALPNGGNVIARVPVPSGSHPGSADNQSLWLGNETLGFVLRLDAISGRELGRAQVNAGTKQPYDLWPASDGTFSWAAGLDDKALVRIDAASTQVLNRWPIEAVPYRVQPTGNVVWVTSRDAGRVLEIDASNGAVMAAIAVSDATGIAVTPGAVYIASYTGQLVRIDPATAAIVARYDIAPDATDILVEGSDLWIWGINGRRLERVDAGSGRLMAWTEGVRSVAFLSDAPWATLADAAVVRLDPRTLQRLSAVSLGGVEADQMIAAGTRLWLYAQAGDQTFVYAVTPG